MLSVYEDKNEIAKRKINRMDKILKDKKFIFKILRALLVVVVVFVLILMPFAIENIIYNETTFSFYHLIKAGRDVWFSFIGSYLGAIGTVLLGALALWQTKKYKKASDKTDEIFKILQEKIKELVQANTDLAEENKNANWLIMNGNRIQIKRKQFEKIIDKLNPIITKYVRAIYDGDKEDIREEYILALWEAVNKIQYVNSDGECLKYLHTSIKNKFHELYRKQKIHRDNEVKNVGFS